MTRTIAIGRQDFEKIRTENNFYVDKTVSEALRQIEERDYQASLIAKGIPQECIRKYGFAFCGKKVLIGEANMTEAV